MKRNVFTLLIITLLGLHQSFPVSANAVNAPSFLITAKSLADDKVTVNIIVKNMEDLFGYEARFTFDPDRLELVEAKSILDGFSISPKIRGNEIVIAHTKIGNVKGESGDFIISTLTFKSRKVGTSTVTLKSFKEVDHNLDYQTYSLDESVTVGFTNNGTPNNDSGLGNVGSNMDSVNVNEESLKNDKDGKVVVEIAEGKKNVLLPVRAAGIVGNNKLELRFMNFSIFIPVEVLNDLQDLVSSDELEDAQISFKFNKSPEDEKNRLLTSASNKAKSTVTAVGDMIEFSLSIVTKEGKELKLTKFNKPITVKLKVNYHADLELLGIYFIADNGELVYVGGVIADGYMSAEVSHFSRYAVLESDKSFADVAENHWAARAIKVLAAKQIVYGVSDTSFQPNANVTRAEFVAFVVRGLGLKATGLSSFADVNDKAWYAPIVTAANEAGIIKGRSASIFAPNETITREEMTAIIVHAYEYKTGVKTAAEQQNAFADAKEISAWAKDDVNAAFKLGFVSGRGDGRFAPKAWSTRAEATQIIVNLLKKL
ncbi:hypothetical protein Back11_10990 [Paenibacillus baekrokdamisoli]|uniref:Uncharacterized protein n=1 Tax=Paenibacillus baekrokdamisoli TaxID=1712516 RepID=A0A3G9J904_9BACL|nr:S-layer homology domain-containing protein [Paenibacillus baekrokdamisoli]MBB3067056.1 hypothetical protein [Paenibacillus baekrokdamisoli]BBH19754.1 hypothetical protein Back11_10990 [Paenibacillus baekrokdamisoli]